MAILTLSTLLVFFTSSHALSTDCHGQSTATSVLRNAVSNDALGSNHTTHTEDLLIPKPKFSKAKWKKKRYLMMQDVKKKIKQNNPRAHQKAEEMVRRMLKLYEKSGGDSDLRPTLQAYNLWIHALAKSNLRNSGELAEQVMEQMKDHHIWPDVVTYTSVMDAHARSQTPEKAEDVFFRLLDEAPTVHDLGCVTCDTILNAWAQRGTEESAKRAQMILHRLEEWQRDDIRPTRISYATVVNAWAKVGSTEAAEQAEGLLNRMLSPGNKRRVQPDAVVFNAVINAWATSKDPSAGKNAAGLLRKMKKLAVEEDYDTYPDIVTYNSVLSAWSHSGDPQAAAQTEKIVQEMQKTSEESDTAPTPNTITYNTILHAWSKSTLPGAAIRAQKVLDYMIETGEDIAPDVISFGSVLDAWAKSKEPHKAARTRDLLDQLLELYDRTKSPSLKPTLILYNSVLNACAFSALGTSLEEQREALQIAVTTFSNVRKSNIHPDTVTYGNMLKGLANLMPQGTVRTQMALQIFSKCVEEGLVGNLVWNEVRRAVPSRQLEETFRLKRGSCGHLQLRDLPKSWKRNRFEKNAPKNRRKEKEVHAQRPITTIIETAAQSGRDL